MTWERSGVNVTGFGSNMVTDKEFLKEAKASLREQRSEDYILCRERLDALAAISMLNVLVSEAKLNADVEKLVELRKELREMEELL